MKLIYEVTLRDDKVTEHECVDFASFGTDFIVLFKENFCRDMIRTETVKGVKQYFK